MHLCVPALVVGVRGLSCLLKCAHPVCAPACVSSCCCLNEQSFFFFQSESSLRAINFSLQAGAVLCSSLHALLLNCSTVPRIPANSPPHFNSSRRISVSVFFIFFRVYDLKCRRLAESALTASSYFCLRCVRCRKRRETPLKPPVAAEDRARTKENTHVNFYLDPDCVNVLPVFLLRRAVCEVHPFSALSCLWRELTT